MRQKIISTVVLLMAMASSVWAEKYTLTLTPEYTAVPSIYAGVANSLTLRIENTSADAGNNIVARLFCGEILIGEQSIATVAAGESGQVKFVDPIIRPITENTIKGNDNENVVYNVVVTDDSGTNISKESSFAILYNGNLGKDYAYPSYNPTLREFDFTGDVQIISGGEYAASSVTARDESFTIDLDGGTLNKALLYVSYNWDKIADGDFNSWTTTFNGQTIAPIANYRDQTNLGNYGRYAYGMVVYDVTNCATAGDNTFNLQKASGNVALYPSSLIVLVNKPEGDSKSVYILEEADLMAADGHEHAEAIYPSSFQTAEGKEAYLYVFAATAQSGEGDIIINDEPYTNVWAGTSQSVEIFSTAVEPGDISIQFKSTGSTILALHQMVIVEKENATGIKQIDANKSTGRCYDLQGRELKHTPSQKGVYIQGGRKVAVK